MATLEELVVSLTAETSQLRAELNSAVKVTEQATKKMEKALGDFSENSAKNTSFLQQSLASMAGFLGSQAVLGAFGLLKNAAGAVFAELQEGAKAAIAQEQALTQLANALALSGQYSAAAQKDLEDFTTQMEELTGVEDDVIASNLAVLSSLTKLDSEGLKTAQKAALDLSTALNIDLSTATKLVGKGINGNVEAFQRYGIEVQKGGDQTQNFANIMKALAGVNGSAEGALKTFGGTVLSVTNSFDNFVEEISRSVTSNPVLIASLQEISKIFTELTRASEGSAGVLKTAVADAFLGFVNGVGIAITTIDQFLRLMEAGIRTILIPVNALADSIRYLTDIVDGTQDQEAFGNTKAQFEDLQKVVEGDTALSTLAQKVAQVGVAGESAFGQLNMAASATAPTVEGVSQAIVQLTEAERAHNEVIKEFATSLAQNQAALDSNYQYQQEQLAINQEMEILTKEEFFAQSLELQAQQFAAEQAALEQARAQELISEDTYQKAKIGLIQKQNLEEQKLRLDKKKSEDDANKAKLAGLKETFGNISALQQSSNRELAALGKAAAISQATIDGYAAVQGAYKWGSITGGPVLGAAFAALAGAAAAMNIAKIAGASLASGITEVPRNASGGNNGDNFPATLMAGERVVDSQTNQDLKEFLGRENAGGARGMTVNINIQNNLPASREAGNAIIEAINEALANGSIKILGTA